MAFHKRGSFLFLVCVSLMKAVNWVYCSSVSSMKSRSVNHISRSCPSLKWLLSLKLKWSSTCMHACMLYRINLNCPITCVDLPRCSKTPVFSFCFRDFHANSFNFIDLTWFVSFATWWVLNYWRNLNNFCVFVTFCITQTITMILFWSSNSTIKGSSKYRRISVIDAHYAILEILISDLKYKQMVM